MRFCDEDSGSDGRRDPHRRPKVAALSVCLYLHLTDTESPSNKWMSLSWAPLSDRNTLLNVTGWLLSYLVSTVPATAQNTFLDTDETYVVAKALRAPETPLCYLSSFFICAPTAMVCTAECLGLADQTRAWTQPTELTLELSRARVKSEAFIVQLIMWIYFWNWEY